MRQTQTKSPTILICVDGLGPAYLEASDVPNLRSMADTGFLKYARCMMPSVTNVNNVSIVTASYPAAHGICSNYILDRRTGRETYLESKKYILRETLFDRFRQKGAVSILCTAKDKLRTLIGDAATIAFSAEHPPGWVVNGIGPPPEIYSLEVNAWLIRAASFVIGQQHADFAYIATTDYAMHAYAPEESESRRHMSILDGVIGDLVESHPSATVLLTADHGMSEKRRVVDVKDALLIHGIRANPVPIIKDRFTVHHSNLGGSIYLYLEKSDVCKALEILRETPGIEEALRREEAAETLRLHPERIGDVILLGEKDVVFGDHGTINMPERLRSHGSRHEIVVPILGYNGTFEGFSFAENRDIGRYVLERVLT